METRRTEQHLAELEWLRDETDHFFSPEEILDGQPKKPKTSTSDTSTHKTNCNRSFPEDS